MNLEQLREAWHRASEKDKPHDAIKVLVQLEKLEPNEPRWAQRLGEAYRRTGQTPEAVEAFARAFQSFFERGFLPRAIAMAKLVSTLDAARGDLLEKTLPRTNAGPPPLPVRPGPPPLPLSANVGRAKRPAGPPPLPLSVARATPLARAPDSADDEVRFVDDPGSSVQVLLVDFESSDVVVLDGDDDDLPPTMPRLEPLPPGRADSGTYAYGAVASTRLFASLSRDALVALANATQLVEFPSGATIIVRDEGAHALFAIVNGTAAVTVKGAPEITIRLFDGEVFGEGSLLDEGKRQADVRAETALMTLRIEKAALDQVTGKYPEVGDALFDLLARRLIMNLIHSSPLFTSFDQAVRLELAQKFEVRRAEPSTVIAERGRKSDGLYVLLAGDVMAESADGPPRRIARGTVFGHPSLMGGPSNVTVRAATEAVLLRMPASGFSALVATYPPALAHLAETVNEPLPVSRRK
jgi:CRP-like cAMP-binding protein